MKVKVQLRNLPGTQAAVGWAGNHTIIADRPEGKAGGMGMGFNGAQLLALALGGCFCNDLRYVADEMGVEIDEIDAQATVELGGKPLVAISARLDVKCTTLDGTDPNAVIANARKSCMVSNSLSSGVPVSIIANN